MNIRKETELSACGSPNEEQLAQISAYTPKPLTKEQVFVFSLRLCDDQPDRDFERFDAEALPELAKLFVGKTGILDHHWSAEKQVARIFQTEVIREGSTHCIKAWAYMLRQGNEALIRDIEGGIKKEVSVGCQMGSVRCSVCGEPYGSCPHEKGQIYDGERCVAILSQPTDAYEFSFVAVPAQRQAGVIKGWKGGETMALQELAEGAGPDALEELKLLQQQAQIGKAYCETLKGELLRLSAALGLEADRELLRSAVEKLAPEELRGIEAALAKKAAEKYGPATQLPATENGIKRELETDYLI